jgi:hypothetical protein
MFYQPLNNFLKQNIGKLVFGKWELSDFHLMDSDVGFIISLDAFFELYHGDREEINIVVNYRNQAGVDLLKCHTLTEDDKADLKLKLESLGYKDVIIRDLSKH